MKYLIALALIILPLDAAFFHHAIWKTSQGDILQLEDGSRWSVKPSDRFKICTWQTSDNLMVTPNHSWFSTYLYKLSNIDTKESVEIKLSARPDGDETLWIAAFDVENRQVTLSDTSIWTVADILTLKEDWVIDDPILIGHNDGFFSSTFPNILINLETISHTKARRL